MAKQAKSLIKTEYRKARAALLRRVSRARKKGYDVSGFKVPKIPKKITAGSARRLRKMGQQFGKARRSGLIPLIIPSFETRLVEVADDLIEKAQTWIDDSPLSHIRQMNEERIRHRGDEARTEFNNHGLDLNDYLRKVASFNLAKTWPELIEALERFIFDSDQYGYDGDLSELARIFIEMIDTTDYIEDEEAGRSNDEITKYLKSRDWYDTDFFEED